MLEDFKYFVRSCLKQDLPFFCACSYLIFEFLRPHTIFEWLDFLPWAQLSLMIGCAALLLKSNLKFQVSHFYVAMFSIVCALSVLISEFPERGKLVLDVPFSWFVVVLFLSGSIRTFQQFRLILTLFFLILFKMSLFGAKTWAFRGFSFTSWGIAGPRGWFENSGELALIMVIFTCLSFGYIVSQGKVKKIYYLVPLTAAMTVLAASSRGSQLALAVVLVVAALTIWKVNLKNIALGAILVLLGLSFLPAEQKARFESMGSDATSESRLIYWGAGMEMLDENPFLGIGLNAFPEYFERYHLDLSEFKSFSYRSEVAHNTLIQVGSEMGGLGLLFYCLMVFHCYWLSRKIRLSAQNCEVNSWAAEYSKYVDLALLGYFISSFFMSVALYPYIYFLLAINQGLLNCFDYKAATRSANSTAI